MGGEPDPGRGWNIRRALVRVLWVLVLVACAGTAYALYHTAGLLGTKSDWVAVNKVLNDQMEAWNRGDLEGFMDGYQRGDELRFFSGGTVTAGWQPTLDRYRKRYQADGKEMGTLEFYELKVNVLPPDAALARGRWEVTSSQGKSGGLFTLLLRKTDVGWRIVHDHTSAAEPAKKAE